MLALALAVLALALAVLALALDVRALVLAVRALALDVRALALDVRALVFDGGARTLAVSVAAVALLAGCDATVESEVVVPAETAASATAVAYDAAQTESAELLQQITEAERTQVYSGYKTASHGEDGAGRRTRMRVTRLADGRMVLEWNRGGETSRRFVVRHRHRWIDDPSLLLANYDVESSAAESGDASVNDVAYRPVQRVDIRSRRAGRPTLTLFVDVETRLVLAETLRDHDGVQRFAWQFDTIDFEPAPLEVAEAEIVAAPSTDEVDPSDCDWDTLTPSDVPEGFRRVACRLGDDGGLVEYWSDGLAAFALRQKPSADLAGSREGELERRECGGRSSISGVIEGVEIRLLGNLPIDELEAVAAGLRVRP